MLIVFNVPSNLKLPEEPDRDEAEAALTLAREVYDAILSRLPDEVRS